MGVLVEHCLFVDSDSRARLRDDIAELSDAVYAAFLAGIDTVDDDDPAASLPTMEVRRDGAQWQRAVAGRQRLTRSSRFIAWS